MVIVAACGSTRQNTTNNPIGVKNKSIQLKVNEEKTIQLPGWVSDGPQMGFTLSDTSIATVSRKETVSTYDSTSRRPGDPVLDNWVIKGLKRGTTKMKFTGHHSEKANNANLRLKNFEIAVTD